MKLHQNLLILANIGDTCILKHRVLGLKKHAVMPPNDPPLIHHEDHRGQLDDDGNNIDPCNLQADMPLLERTAPKDLLMHDPDQYLHESETDEEFLEDSDDDSQDEEISNSTDSCSEQWDTSPDAELPETTPEELGSPESIDALFEDSELQPWAIQATNASSLDMPIL